MLSVGQFNRLMLQADIPRNCVWRVDLQGECVTVFSVAQVSKRRVLSSDK